MNYAAIKHETVALIKFSPKLLKRRLFPRKKPLWLEELPVQLIPRFHFSDELPKFSASVLRDWCINQELRYSEGGDSIYLPPETWALSPLNWLRPRYPAETGVKLCKSLGDSNQPYMGNRSGRAVSRMISFPHRMHLLTFNFLQLEGVAPRLYDIVEIEGEGKQVWVAYVVQHITAAEVPSAEDLHKIVSKLKLLERQRLIQLISSAGWGGVDFEGPDCNANLIRAVGSNQSYYVDIHNFVLDRYENHLLKIAKDVSHTTHFGAKSSLLGGKFLYQEIPGVDLPAKRSPSERMKVFDQLLLECGLSLANKVVFDIGCNLGLMGAEYLHRGARWIHGWDMPEVIQASSKVLLSIGCTRFSLTGGKLSEDARLFEQLPLHLQSVEHDDVFLSYLAIRGHVGWLPSLKHLPWNYMLYEGHQEDGDIEGDIAQLNEMISVRLLAKSWVTGGLSSIRPIGIVERLIH